MTTSPPSSVSDQSVRPSSSPVTMTFPGQPRPERLTAQVKSTSESLASPAAKAFPTKPVAPVNKTFIVRLLETKRREIGVPIGCIRNDRKLFFVRLLRVSDDPQEPYGRVLRLHEPAPQELLRAPIYLH